jgi:hypothetical protein
MVKLPATNTIEKIYQAFEDKQKPYYSNSVNPSSLGKPCLRELWYKFRWVKEPESFDGRMLRLFETGQLEEDRFVKDLRAAGITVWDKDTNAGNQINAQMFNGFLNGYVDSVGIGFIEAKDKYHVIEMKTHSNKSFNDLVKKKVQLSKPEHYTQMMLYMGILEIDRAYYLAVNKDTDELYGERIKFSQREFDASIEKAERIIFDDSIPERITESPLSFLCRFCNYKDICFENKLPQKNCRTCVHGQAKRNDGRYNCCMKNCNKCLNKQDQLKGCNKHLYNPEFIHEKLQAVDEANNLIEYETFLNKDGEIISKNA